MIFAIIAFLATVVSITLGLTVGVNLLGFTDGFIIRSVANTLLLLVLINIVCACCFQWIMVKRVNPFNKRYKVHKWEEKFYLKLGVRKWKDKIPELGKLFAGFDKSQVGDLKDNEHVKHFLVETITAEYIHKFSAIFGLLAVVACLKTWYIVGVPLLLANFVINSMPVIVQRYNRPKLMMLYARNERNNTTVKEQTATTKNEKGQV